MYEDIMRRPMFQTPQQRAGGGIMRGVAPVQGYQEGGEINPFGMPGSSAGQVPEESLSNGLADTAFKLLVVDYNDPVDIALATITAGLMATGVAAPVAALTAATRLGLKGRKVKQVLDRAQSVGEKLAKPTENASFRNPLGEVKKDAGIFSKVTAPVVSNMAVRETDDIVTDPVGYASDWADTGRAAVDLGDAVYDVATEDDEGVFSETMKGIASLPVRMADGGDIGKGKKSSAFKEIIEWVTEKVRRGEIDEVEAETIVRNAAGKKINDIDKVFEQVDLRSLDTPTFRRRARGTDQADEAARNKQLNQDIDDAIAGLQARKISDAPDAPDTPTRTRSRDRDEPKTEQEKTSEGTSTATSKGEIESSQDAANEVLKKPGILRRNKKKVIGGVIAAPVLAPPVAGVVDEFAGTELAPAVREKLGDFVDFGSQGLGRVAKGVVEGYLGDPEEKPKAPVLKSYDPTVRGLEGFEFSKPGAPPVPLSTSTPPQEEREKVLPGFRPFGGKIARALLGEDEAFGGDKGAIDFIREGDYMSKVMSALSDPKMRYQLSQAAKATEGFVPRNFFTDIEEAGQAYDDMVAQRDYLEAQTRDVDKTDMEKTVDYYMDSISKANPEWTEEQLAAIRTGMNMSLFKSSRDAAELAAKMEILSLVPNATITTEMYNKLIQGSVDQELLDMIGGNITPTPSS